MCAQLPNRFLPRLSTALVVCYVLLLCFSHLGHGHLAVDAIRYAGIAKKIQVDGNWFYPFDLTEDSIYFNKPPLLLWLLAAAFSLFGFSTFLAKSIAVVFAAGALLLGYHTLQKSYSTKVALLFVLLLTLNRTFFRDIIELNFDGLALFGSMIVLASSLALIRSPEMISSYRFWFPLHFGLFLLFQSKIPYLVLVSFPLAVHLYCSGMLMTALRQPALYVAMTPFAILEAAWLIHCGWEYFAGAAHNQFIEPMRSNESLLKRLATWGKSALVSWAPLSPLAMYLLYSTWRQHGARTFSLDPAYRLLSLWILPIIPIVVLAGNRPRYLLIPMVGAAALAAILLAPRISERLIRPAYAILISVLLIVLVVSGFSGKPLHRKNKLVELLQRHPEIDRGLLTICVVDRDPLRLHREPKFMKVLLWLEFDRWFSVQPVEAITDFEQPLLTDSRCREALEPQLRHRQGKTFGSSFTYYEAAGKPG
jgi:4-amino-4-deoxy-L-arabinose transferase-like glycosyltransferase